jgi:hypothetical protein
MVTFPRDRTVKLRDIGTLPAKRRRAPGKKAIRRKSA